MILFIKDVLPVEVVSLLGLISLIITRVLTPDEAFSGFGDPALITIAAVFILSSALSRTGVTDYLAQKIERHGQAEPARLVLLLMATVTVISAFMNNVAATAVLLPVTIGMAQRSKIHPGKLLMPIAFGSMLGGTCTAIGTSTNMVMSTFLSRNGFPPFHLFEFTPIGLAIAVVGIAYMLTLGKRLLPERGDVSLEESYHLRDYITEIVILNDSPLIGKTIRDSQIGEKLDLTVIGLSRQKQKLFVLRPNEVLQSGDLLLVEGRIDQILKIKDTFGIEIKPDFKLTGRELTSDDVKLAEVVIAPGADIIGKSLKEIRFRQRYKLVALALHRGGRSTRWRISQMPLELGDVLLVQGKEEDIRALRLRPDFLLLEGLPVSRFKRGKAGLAISIFLAVILVGGSQVVPIVVAAIIGALLMVLARCITLSDAYGAVNWSTIVLIAGMTSIGVAMEKTGLAGLIASGFIKYIGSFGSHALLVGFFILTVILTQPMSNAAAALLVAPIALSTARSLHLNPRAFIMTVALAASSSFMTPLEPACALVYGPGHYKFADFLKVGVLLTLILMVLVVYMVPLLWPLNLK
jgi:di/tricarboxylate transporter